MFAMYRLVSETWLAVHTATTDTGASTQPITMSTAATGVRQEKRCRRGWSDCFRRSSVTSVRRRSSSARSSLLRPPA